MPIAYRDSLNFIGKLTFAKISNIFQITASFYLSQLTRKVTVWGKPISLSIEPTTSCNLKCPECPSGLKKFNTVEVLKEDRTLAISSGRLTDDFKPFDVHIYKLN